MIRGCIFDMDGVLVNNAEIHILAWRQLGEEVGTDLQAEAVRAVFGQRNKEMVPALFGRDLTGEKVANLARRKEVIYRQLMAPALTPTPGTIDFLRHARIAGLATAVATSGPIENTDLVLDGLKIRSCFDAIVTGGDVKKGKPDPEIFLIAAGRLGLQPVECVVFEDSASGIEAAHRAGCLCVALATTHTPRELRQYSPARVISNFTEISPQELASLAG